MAQVLYGLIRDNGDGSSRIEWHTNKEKVDALLDEDEYFANESSPSVNLTLPDGLDLKAAGFRNIQE